MNLTHLFGKQVFALYEGEIVGTICDAIFSSDLTKVTGLKMFDQDENEYEIKFSKIKAMKDCVVIANKEKLSIFYEKLKKTPLFKPVITENADTLGKVVDCIVGADGTIEHFVTDINSMLEPSKIYLRKRFIYYSEAKFVCKNVCPKKAISSLENIKVNILSFDAKQKYDNFVPNKLQYNAESIVGKTAKATLFGVNNEVIIKANQTISEKTIEDASRHNRLNQLYFLAN